MIYLKVHIFNVTHKLVWQLHRFLILLGLRHRQQYWGTVYDSANKQPLDPVIVKLVNVANGEVVETCVSDMAGHYSFLASPGRYKILVKKSNYSFPSYSVKGDKDGIFSNLYRGEFFDLAGDSDVVAFNIPMDPEKPDWNQKAKQEVVKFSPFLEHLLSAVMSMVFWFILVLAVIKAFSSPSLLVWVVLGFYAVTILLAVCMPRPRFWGRVWQAKDGQPFSAGTLELSHQDLPGIVIAKSRTFEDGKFFIRTDPGKYLLKITGQTETGEEAPAKTLSVRVGQEGVMWQDIAV